jgi:hypothetical protein
MAKRKRVTSSAAPDLQTQLETLLDQVWKCEAEWRLDRPIAVAMRLSGAFDVVGR